jgi:hypothetical protein
VRAEPAAPRTISGALEGASDSATIRVAGRTVELYGIDHAPANDQANKLAGWVEQNGGQVTCTASNSAFHCETSSGMDVGLAIIVNGAGLPAADAPEQYRQAGTTAQMKTAALQDNPNPALVSLFAGSIVLDCQMSCGFAEIFGGWKTNAALYARQDWVGLTNSVQKIGFQIDINYYFLGRAAEAYGAYGAAVRYYRKAGELAATDFEPNHCLRADLDMCAGVNLAAELPQRIQRASALARFEFN